MVEACFRMRRISKQEGAIMGLTGKIIRRLCVPLLGLLGSLVVAGIAGCGRDTASSEAGSPKSVERIMVVGASTIAPLLSEMGKSYEKSHPDIRIEVQAGGSSRGVLDVRHGVAKLGMVSRELTPDEQDLQSVLIAKDGVGIILHKTNPVARLSKSQVVGIYTGKLTNWKQLGGEDLPITVVSKAEGRSTLDIFSHYFGVPYKEISAHVIIGDNQQGIQTVAGSPSAIGYVSIGSAEYEAQQGAAIRLVQMDDQVPTTAAVASGQYAISRELNLVFKPPLSDRLRDFVEFVQSEAVAELVTKQYFVPVAQR